MGNCYENRITVYMFKNALFYFNTILYNKTSFVFKQAFFELQVMKLLSRKIKLS